MGLPEPGGPITRGFVWGAGAVGQRTLVSGRQEGLRGRMEMSDTIALSR